jgi:hypothetical protein
MCALNKQLIVIPFNQGIDTKHDPKQLTMGKLIDLQNGIFQHTESVDKRWGYNKLSSAILGTDNEFIESCVALNAFQNELINYDGRLAYSYSQSNQGWLNRGNMISVIQTEQQIIRNNYSQSGPDSASLDGVEVFAWTDGRGGVRYSVVDITDTPSAPYLLIDQPIYSTQGNTANTNVKVLPFPAAKLIVILYNFRTNIFYVTIDPNNPYNIATSGTVLVSNGNASSDNASTYYDAAIIDNQLFLLYYSSSGNQIQLTSFDKNFNQTAISNVFAYTGFSYTGCLSIAGDSNNNVWVTYPIAAFGMNANTTIYSNDLATIILPSTQTITQTTGIFGSITSIIQGTTGYIFAEAVGNQTYNNVIYTATCTLSGIVSPTTVLKRSVGLVSKPFVNNDTIYLNIAFQSPLQNTYFTMDQFGNIVGKTNPWLAGGLIGAAILPECQQILPGIFEYANLVKGSPITQAGTLFQLLGINSTRLNFIQPNQFISSEMNGNLFTVGGIVQSYDSSQYTEVNYHVYPEGMTDIINPTGGSLVADGYYQYVWTYEWNDNNGNTQFSYPSVPILVKTGDGYDTFSVTFTVPTLRLTNKSNVRIVGYRTTNLGSLLFRCTSGTTPIYNDPTIDTITFTDTISDTDLQSNGLLYTQPFTIGENPILPNNAPPSCSFMITYNNRIFLGGLEDPNTLWFSKQRIIGVPMEFSDQNTIQIDAAGGAITALGVLNNALIIFKENGLYSLVGQGPDNTGSNNDFNTPGPVNIPSPVGCTDPNSVALTPKGLLFDSGKGIYLLDLSGNVSYVGAPVEKYNSLTIKSATVVPPQWIIFTTETNANTGDIPVGLALIYDYLFDQWGTFTNHDAVDSCIWLGGDDTFVYGRPDGSVMQQSVLKSSISYQNYADGQDYPISLSTTTANLDFGNLQGLQRVYHVFILGTYYGAHTLEVAVAYDWAPDFTNFTTINIPIPTSPYGDGYYGDGYYGGQPFQYQFRIDLMQQKCQAIRIQIRDLQSANIGIPFNQGMALSALTFRVGIKPQGARLPASKQFGNK